MKRKTIMTVLMFATVAMAAMADIAPTPVSPGVGSVAMVWLCLFVFPIFGISLLIAILNRFIARRRCMIQKGRPSMHYIIIIILASIPLAYFITVAITREVNKIRIYRKEHYLCSRCDSPMHFEGERGWGKHWVCDKCDGVSCSVCGKKEYPEAVVTKEDSTFFYLCQECRKR